MNKKIFGLQFTLALAFFLIFLSGCQEEKEPAAAAGAGAENSGAGSASPASTPPAAPSPEAAARQSAPVPEGTRLEILLLGPSGQMRRLTQIAAMFNQPMAALGDYDNVPEGAMKLDPPQEGGFKWLNQYTLAFIPKEPLEGSAEIRAEIPAGIKALSGAVLETGKTISISLPRLEALEHYLTNDTPLDEAEALKPEWTLVLNQKVDLESLREKSFFIYKGGDGEVKTAAEVSGGERNRYREGGYAYVFKPVEKLPQGTDYQLTLEEGVKSLAGPIPSKALTLGGRTFGPLRLEIGGYYADGSQAVDPAYGVSVYFSNPVKMSEAVRALKIDNGYDLAPLRKEYAGEQPPLKEGEINVDDYQTGLYIPGGFKPGTAYAVSFDENLTDVFGQKLGPAEALRFRTGQYETSVRLDSDFGLMETSTEARVPLVVSNIESARVRGYAFKPEEAALFLSRVRGVIDPYNDVDQALERIDPDPAGQTFTPPEGAKNGPLIMPVDLAAMFGDRLKGHLLYLRSSWLEADSKGKTHKYSTQSFVQISDIGLAVKTAPGGGLVWTTNLAEGRAWPRVDLELYSPHGRQLWRGQSDENGLARLPGSTELLKHNGEERDIFVVARAGGQMSIWDIRWDEGLEPWRWNLNYGDPLYSTAEKRHWLLSALPLYKPGETAEFKVIAREKTGEVLSDLAGRKMLLRVSDGQGRTVSETAVETDAFGAFSHKLEIPQDAALGSWSVNIGPENAQNLDYAGSFLVMTYRAPAFEIKVGELPRAAVAGDEAALSVEAVYHFGAPVSGQPVAYSVTSSPYYWFSLPGLSEYNFVNTFSDADGYDDAGAGYHEPTATVASDTAALDAGGAFSFGLNLTPAPGLNPRPRNYRAYFTVTDVDLREVSANASFLVHPAELYVGLRAENFLARAGETYALKALAADLAGNYVAGRNIRATLYRRDWQNVRRRTPGNAYEYVSRVVDEEVGRAEAVSGQAPVDLLFSPDKAGYYWVLAEISDERGRLNQTSWGFYATGDGPVGWRMENDDRLTLVADKKSYKPGETARILVQSPFAEGEGLLTLERAGVREARTFKIENQTPTLEVPIGEDDAPNIFVSVLLSRGRIADKPDENGVDLGKPAIRMGYVELKVPTTRDLLTVEVVPGRTEVGPGGEVEVEISVKDDQGRPFSEAAVALLAADAAVLQLAGDDGYYPDRLFLRDEPLLVLTADNLTSLIGRRQWGLKGGNPGGGGADMAMASNGGDAANVRRLFKALAHFEPSLALDEEGRARTGIKMPENLTTFKIYAVATGHGRKSGTGSASVLVSRDLLARSALPGYAGVGDAFAAAMVITNRGRNSGQAKVTLSGDNFTLREGESAEKTVSIEPGQSREVPFQVKTGQAGQARFLFSLSMGAESDAAEYVIDVIPPNHLVTQASYELLTPGEKRVDVIRPGGIDPTRGGLELTLAPSLLGVLSEPFRYLAEYPHRCVEQETSRAWGRLLRLELKDRLPDGHDPAKLQAARDHVDTHLQRLVQWERGGGYSFWPNDSNWRNRSVRLTAYILEFVASARQAGFSPPAADLEQNIAGFLQQALNSDFAWPHWYSEEAKAEARSYALSALSRAGMNATAYQEHLYQKRDGLSLIQLVNLIRAIGWQPRGGGQAEQLRELLPLLLKHLTLTAGEAQFVDNSPGAPELWANHTGNTARILETLCLTAPHNDLVAPLLRNLVNQSKDFSGHFGGTQNNVAALAALAAYARALEPEVPNLAVKALMGETSLALASFSSFTDPPVTAARPAALLAEAASALIYQAEGRGQAWASLKLKTAPLEPDLSADTSGGFMLSRSFTVIRPENGPEGAEKFRRGDTVRVTVTMMVPVPRYNVVLEDRVPAGFEPINFNLADADQTLAALVNEDDSEGRRHWYNHQEIRPERVDVYADYLGPGVYTFSYLARAVTVGRYITPGPTAEEMYSPETYGRGQGQVLTVE